MPAQPENVEKLVGLLSRGRQDPDILRFVGRFPDAVCAGNREDGADDEYIEFKGQGLTLLFERDVLVSVALQSKSKSEDCRTYPSPFRSV